MHPPDTEQVQTQPIEPGAVRIQIPGISDERVTRILRQLPRSNNAGVSCTVSGRGGVISSGIHAMSGESQDATWEAGKQATLANSIRADC